MQERNGFEERLQEMIEKALRERQNWESRKAEADARLRELETKITAYQTTLHDYKLDKGEIFEEKLSFDRIRFNGKTVGDCCEIILDRLGGKAKVAQVARTLQIAEKITKDYKVAYAQVYNVMNTDPRFVRTGAGEFQLVKTTQ